ncbi:MAG: penicillin acylase family protein [Magnetospiraceae bacterium]
MSRSFLKTLGLGTGALSLFGCALATPPPEPSTIAERLAMIPAHLPGLAQSVTLRWNAHQVPFIEAATDADAAYALGVVHAHLRLGQMELGKRIVQGRLSEMTGPFLINVDKALRILDFGKAADEILATMPGETRTWLASYVAGINAYKATLSEAQLPHEYALFNLDPAEPWTPQDSLALGRLAGTDVNWLAWFRLLKGADQPEFDERFQAAVARGQASAPSMPTAEEDADLRYLNAILESYSKSGSNSVVVGAARSATGKGMIANDPHLGFLIPNAWLLLGVESPSYKLVGMMPPGVPAFAFGRTPHIAWGGTNLRGLSSDLVDLTEEEAVEFSKEEETVWVRSWFDAEVSPRQSAFGPVISDAALVPNPTERILALRWMGHAPSDEITALLGVAKARDWAGFVAALEPFSVPGQNFLFVDNTGGIGHVVATHLPKRPPEHGERLFVPPGVSEQAWAEILTTKSLPKVFNPPAGVLHSANNRPAETDYPIGYLFPPDERHRRVGQLLGMREKLTLEDLKALQQDTVSLNSLSVIDALADVNPVDWAPEPQTALRALRTWDGAFAVEATEPVLFIALMEALIPQVFKGAGHPQGTGPQTLVDLVDRLSALPRPTRQRYVQHALKEAIDRSEGKKWGDIHRLSLKYQMAQIPVLGNRYKLGDYPLGGSLETVQKAAHPLTADRHNAFFGAQSRHLSDMSDPDANFFVLIGGNDGWINSQNANDQTDLFLKGEYIQMPLTGGAVRERHFPHQTIMVPSSDTN